MSREETPLRPPGDAAEPRPEETTQAEEEWPVPPLYVVEPDSVPAEDAPARRATSEQGSVAVAEPPRSRFRRSGAALAIAALAILLLVAGAVAAVTLRGEESGAASPPSTSSNLGTTTSTTEPTTEPTAEPAARVEVPNAVGLEVADARSLLRKAGLRVRTHEVESERPTGIVTEQSRASGESVAPNAIVVLDVSRGVTQTAVPDVVGLEVSIAKDELRAAGLRHEVRSVRSDEPLGRVLDQEPAADTQVDPESVVRLEVSSGIPKVVVPRLVGSWSSVAQRRLRQLGLRWTVSELASAKPKGTVIGQSPNAGAQVRKGQTVTLEISTGPVGVLVPDVTGLDEYSARQELDAAGFLVRVRGEPTDDPDQDGIVVGQDPPGGARAKEGGTVTLTVSRFG